MGRSYSYLDKQYFTSPRPSCDRFGHSAAKRQASDRYRGKTSGDTALNCRPRVSYGPACFATFSPQADHPGSRLKTSIVRRNGGLTTHQPEWAWRGSRPLAKTVSCALLGVTNVVDRRVIAHLHPRGLARTIAPSVATSNLSLDQRNFPSLN